MIKLQEVSRGHSTIGNGKDLTIVVFEMKEGEIVQELQKTNKIGYLYEGKMETESIKGVYSTITLDNTEKDGATSLLDKMLDRDNLNKAYKRVKKNGGSSGTDNMSIEEMLPYLKENREELLRSIRRGKYKPKPVRRVEIPKPDGGIRLLGVPTVIDRMLQQALVQVLEPIFEPTFSDNSYGFRPNRNAHQAIKRAKEYYEEGYTQVVDIDLAKYFDTVNHDILMDMIAEKVKDKLVLKLIRAYLKSGVMVNGIISKTEEGTPQGGNLSPMLSNIYLTAFGRMLANRGHKFVRYADDCNIYVKSRRATERVMESCTKYLEGKLKLTVNKKKSTVGSPLKLKFLGYSMYKIRGRVGIRPHQKSYAKFKNKVKEITKRNRGRAIEQILKELKLFTTGWIAYYKICDMQNKMKQFNEWIRRRIRQYIWKQWKKISAKFSNLQKLGINKYKAWEWANTRKGYWRIADSYILHRTLTNEYLTSIGYDNISKRYEALH